MLNRQLCALQQDENHCKMDGPPNFRLLSTAFHNAGTEIDKLPNLPLIKHGDKFLALLEDMQREMTENFARIDEKFARMDEKFSRIDDNFARVDENFALVHQELGNLSTRITARYLSSLSC